MAMLILTRSSMPRRNLLRVKWEERGMAGETAGRKKVVKGAAARTWRSGNRGYMKRTSL
jgi:hypothetical protein